MQQSPHGCCVGPSVGEESTLDVRSTWVSRLATVTQPPSLPVAANGHMQQPPHDALPLQLCLCLYSCACVSTAVPVSLHPCLCLYSCFLCHNKRTHAAITTRCWLFNWRGLHTPCRGIPSMFVVGWRGREHPGLTHDCPQRICIATRKAWDARPDVAQRAATITGQDCGQQRNVLEWTIEGYAEVNNRGVS